MLHGVPESITTDNGPPYQSDDWVQLSKEQGFKIIHATTEHPEGNSIIERFIAVLQKIIHVVKAEGRDPIVEIRRRLLNYRNTMHPSTGKTPAQVMMKRYLRTRIPSIKKDVLDTVVEEAIKTDKAVRNIRKEKFDAKKKTTDKIVIKGDRALIKQKKTSVKPPFDPRPYIVQEIKGTQATLKRGDMIRK